MVSKISVFVHCSASDKLAVDSLVLLVCELSLILQNPCGGNNTICTIKLSLKAFNALFTDLQSR